MGAAQCRCLLQLLIIFTFEVNSLKCKIKVIGLYRNVKHNKMPKKGNKAKACRVGGNSPSSRTNKCNKNEDCIFIGKENMEKWKEMKNKFNFVSDQEFASCLLDYFSNEKSFTLKKPTRKEIENKSPNSFVVERDKTECPNISVSKKPGLFEDVSQVENSSSVIVINKAVVNDIVEEEAISTTNIQDETKENTFFKHEETPLVHEVQTETSNSNKETELKKENYNQTQLLEHNKVKQENCHDLKQRKHKKKKAILEAKVEYATNDGKAVKQKKKRTNILETSCEEPVGRKEAEVLSTTREERVAITIRLCGDCELHHLQDACPLRKPVAVIADAVSLGDWKKDTSKDKSFAEASLPLCLELREGEGGVSGVVARQALQAFVQLGPLVGRPITEREIPDDSTMQHIWELNDTSGSHYLSTSDVNDSNWLRYVRPAATRSSRNVEVVLRNNQLVFVTTSPVAEGEELLFWAENTNTAWSQKKLNKTKCGGCNLSFNHTLYYRLHCTVFHDPSYSLTVRKYHCKVCGCSVLGKENIVKHAAEKHNGKGAYQCQFCNKFFLRLNYLEMHRTYGCSANPNRSRPLCDYCGRKFCQPQKLKVHIKRMHSEMLEVLRDFQCKHCLKILGSRAALQRHFKEVHQKDVVGAFTCDRCGKMFQNKSNLKIHMLTHSGIKPFKCRESQCPAAFTTKQCLQFHYRKVHGLAEDCMPPIQRSVEYTFDAYAGGRRPDSVNSDSQCSSDGDEICERSPLSPPISVTGDQASQPATDSYSNVVASKGSKKWIGDSNKVNTSKSNVFDFDEDDKEQDVNVSHIDEEPIPMLFHNCKQDSTNASLLVEAALDAAERDIDMPSKISSPIALVTNKEPYPVLRSHLPSSPLGLSRPVSPVEYPIQDQSQSPHLAMESCYSTMSPRHPYSLMFPERTPHYDFRLSPPPGQMDSFHLEDSRYDHHRRVEENSNDEGINLVQNLSLGLKNKPIQLDMGYKYDNLEERSFESVEGLDMSRTGGYHHSFVSVTPRYPPTLYEPRSYSHTDVLRVVNFSHSVDLSLPRSHHQLTPPMNQTLIEPIRIISPPPPPYQTYPLSTSPSPYTRSHSPTYHHYNTSYQ